VFSISQKHEINIIRMVLKFKEKLVEKKDSLKMI
jgi:hypothetical protein